MENIEFQEKEKYVDNNCSIRNFIFDFIQGLGEDDDNEEVAPFFENTTDKYLINSLNFVQYCIQNNCDVSSRVSTDGNIHICFESDNTNNYIGDYVPRYVLMFHREDFRTYGEDEYNRSSLVDVARLEYNENMSSETLYQQIISEIYNFEHNEERILNLMDDIDIIAHWDWELLTRQLLEKYLDILQKDIDDSGEYYVYSFRYGIKKSDGWEYFQDWQLNLKVYRNEINEWLND